MGSFVDPPFINWKQKIFWRKNRYIGAQPIRETPSERTKKLQKPEDFEERETEEADIKSDEPLNKKAKIGQNDESDSGNEEIGGNEEADIEIGQNGANNEPAEEFTKDTKVRLSYLYVQRSESIFDRLLNSGFSVGFEF